MMAIARMRPKLIVIVTWPKRKVPHRGFQFYLLMTMVSPSTRAHSEMHSVFAMAGHCHRPLLNATVAQPSQQTMQ